MSENATPKNWMVILTVLLLVGMVIAGPLLTAQVGPEAHTIDLPLPIAINGNSSVALTSLQAIGGLALLIVGAIIVVGGGIMFVFSRLEKRTADVMASESYRTAETELKKLDAARIGQFREGRPTDGIPNHQRSRWSAISSSLVIILFTIFFGMLLNGTLIPESEYVVDGRTASSIPAILIGLLFASFLIFLVRNRMVKAQTSTEPVSWDTVWVTAAGILVVGVGLSLLLYYSGSPDVQQTVNSAVPVVGGLVLTALFILAWRIHPQKINDIDQTDNSPIPWDFLWVFVTGLLVVGLGIALVIYFNTPG